MTFHLDTPAGGISVPEEFARFALEIVEYLRYGAPVSPQAEVAATAYRAFLAEQDAVSKREVNRVHR